MGQHILIVEDEPLNAILFEKILRKGGGFDVTVSENVDEILRLVRSGSVSLVIMDVSLSNSFYQGVAVDGVAITRLLKALPPANRVPVVLATAHAMRGDAERLIGESGADAYISKPILNYQDLIVTVRKLLRDGGTPSDTGPAAPCVST
ncbi:MAG: response regulator [Planctomycetes bacterium]|nr:response regulator [Planctomycetota bacterium]MBI3843864.1 response regulator [Planctomycetota bacterium]